MEDIYRRRKEYIQRKLEEKDMASHPIDQFCIWLCEACDTAGIEEPQAMSVATVDEEMQPFSRIVLLRKVSKKEGFVFFTNYASDKGCHLALNHRVSLLFYWAPLERQVHIQGAALRISKEASDTYFASRPFESQISAHASTQSTYITDRTILEEKYKRLYARYNKERTSPRPSYWGGIRVIPNKVEFWQGRANRMHDRLQYIDEGGDDKWIICRRSP